MGVNGYNKMVTARNAVNDVGRGACKIMPNNEIGFRFRNKILQS